MVMPLAVTLMYGQRIANTVGSYTNVWPMYDQHLWQVYWKENYKSNTWHKIQKFNCIINFHIVAIKVSPQTFLSASNVSLAVFA